MITLALLADKLEIDGLVPRNIHSTGRELKGVRLWPPSDLNSHENYAYIIDLEAGAFVRGTGGAGNSLAIDDSLIFDDSRDYLVLAKTDPQIAKVPYIYIPTTAANMQQVLEYVQGIFEYYADWSKRLMLSAVTKRDIQDLLEISYPVFNNPLYVVDAAFVLVAATLKVEVKNPTPQWLSIVEYGGLSEDIVRKMPLHQLQELDKLSSASFTPTIENLISRNITAHIDKDGSRIANLAILECDSSFSDYHLALADHLMHCIRYVIDSENEFGSLRGTLYERWLICLLQGSSIDDKLLYPHLSRLKWAINDSYQVAVIRFLRKRQFGTTALSYHWPAIAQIVFGNKCFIYNDSITILFHFAKGEREQIANRDTLTYYVCANELCCTFSSVFNSVRDIHPFLRQATSIQGYTSADNPVLSYTDCITHYFFEQFTQTEGWRDYLHPVIIKLDKYDKEHGLQLVETLYYYLLSNRSLKRCSGRLNIHRSTLVYRINKIQAEYDVNFDDDEMRLSLLLSCGICLKYSQNIPQE